VEVADHADLLDIMFLRGSAVAALGMVGPAAADTAPVLVKALRDADDRMTWKTFPCQRYHLMRSSVSTTGCRNGYSSSPSLMVSSSPLAAWSITVSRMVMRRALETGGSGLSAERICSCKRAPAG
jgi:hypothetical protein